MAAQLTLTELKKLTKSGEIDTVLACMVDMQGRLMGKRFVAQHYVESAHEETHCCNYLLATDLEMHTVSGYRATSWAGGYGDYTMRPDPATLRRAAWLEGTAIVLCDVLDHHGHHEVALSDNRGDHEDDRGKGQRPRRLSHQAEHGGGDQHEEEPLIQRLECGRLPFDDLRQEIGTGESGQREEQNSRPQRADHGDGDADDAPPHDPGRVLGRRPIQPKPDEVEHREP